MRENWVWERPPGNNSFTNTFFYGNSTSTSKITTLNVATERLANWEAQKKTPIRETMHQKSKKKLNIQLPSFRSPTKKFSGSK